MWVGGYFRTLKAEIVLFWAFLIEWMANIFAELEGASGNCPVASTKQFEPVIIGFLCYWCSYAGADLAGGSRREYPSHILPIRVMCSGRVSPHHILKAFQMGADGVLVAGCHLGECHYLRGNYMTAKRIPVMKELLKFIGISPDRLRLEWVSASEGDRFASVVTEFSRQIQALGPSPLRTERREGQRHS